MGKAAMAVAATAMCGGQGTAVGAENSRPPIVVFSKVYQTLKLNFDEAADVTAEAGLEGVDCPVRPGGEILPENVAEQLPRYAGALQKRRLGMPLLTTAITSLDSPNTEGILRSAKRAGVQYYRLGFIERQGDSAAQIREVKMRLEPLAALNRKIGIGALIQNHSPSGKSYLGGDLAELREIVNGFDPDQIGVAFDIGHALVVHGEKWRELFEKLKAHLKIAYVKDVKPGPHWVPFGQGDIEQTGYFKLLKEIKYHAPVSLHIEFDWTKQGKAKNRAALVKALRQSGEVLRRWLAEA